MAPFTFSVLCTLITHKSDSVISWSNSFQHLIKKISAYLPVIGLILWGHNPPSFTSPIACPLHTHTHTSPFISFWTLQLSPILSHKQPDTCLMWFRLIFFLPSFPLPHSITPGIWTFKESPISFLGFSQILLSLSTCLPSLKVHKMLGSSENHSIYSLLCTKPQLLY